jgi:hypothetical protein
MQWPFFLQKSSSLSNIEFHASQQVRKEEKAASRTTRQQTEPETSFAGVA